MEWIQPIFYPTSFDKEKRQNEAYALWVIFQSTITRKGIIKSYHWTALNGVSAERLAQNWKIHNSCDKSGLSEQFLFSFVSSQSRCRTMSIVCLNGNKLVCCGAKPTSVLSEHQQRFSLGLPTQAKRRPLSLTLKFLLFVHLSPLNSS